MAINPSVFYLHNVTDTCSVWNVISSKKVYRAVKSTEVVFYCTDFVIYECLYKPRGCEDDFDKELVKRLTKIREDGDFLSYSLDIEDLQSIELLRARKRLGLGELSSIAFAMKTRQAFLTDDQPARKFAQQFPAIVAVQTVPHLLSWLFYDGKLTDSDKNEIINEHEEVGRGLSKFFELAYMEALRCRLMANGFSGSDKC
jgi:predicted nucleic acid-binding protein